MSSPFLINRRNRGFTLIELLTVIAVISILMGLLFPAVIGAKKMARKAQAKNDCIALVTAVKAYYTEYGIYPLNSQNAAAGSTNGGSWDTCYGDPNPTYQSADLCNILRAIPDSSYNQNNQLNARQVIYFEGNNARDAVNPRGGFAAKDFTGPNGKTVKAGSYIDPWGMAYVVFLDANYDGNVNQAASWFYQSPNTPVVNTGVAACSLGADYAWGTAGDGKFDGSDDVASWQ